MKSYFFSEQSYHPCWDQVPGNPKITCPSGPVDVAVAHRLLHEYIHGIPFTRYRSNLRVLSFFDSVHALRPCSRDGQGRVQGLAEPPPASPCGTTHRRLPPREASRTGSSLVLRKLGERLLDAHHVAVVDRRQRRRTPLNFRDANS